MTATSLATFPAMGALKLGDIITFDRKVDTRNWWQRHLPRWLGGLSYDPRVERVERVVTSLALGAPMPRECVLCQCGECPEPECHWHPLVTVRS